MATYSTTFSGQTTGANATNFTDRYTSETAVSVENPGIGEQDSRVLQFGTGDSGWIFQSFDDVDGDANRANSEILMKYRITTDAQRQAIATLRASGSAGSETCYTVYVNGDDFSIVRWVSSSATLLTSIPMESTPSQLLVSGTDDFAQERGDEWHWVRARVNGTGATVTIQGKIWADGYDEPDYWFLEYQDTSASRITAAGWTGFSKRIFSGTSYLDYFGVGTNGDTAPSPSDDTGNTLRVTKVEGNVLLSGSEARVTRVGGEVLLSGGDAKVTRVGGEVLLSGGEARVTSVYAQVLRQTIVAGSTTQSIPCMIIT